MGVINMSYQKPQVLAGNQTEKLYAMPGMSKNGDLVPCYCFGPLK